jgi:hypothetical protein
VNGLLRRAGGSLVLNALFPWVVFQVLTARGVSAVVALAATALFPVIGTAVGWVRVGRPDVLGLLSVLFIGLTLAAALLTDNPLVILLRRSVTTGVFALLCFGSLAVGRPLMFFVARQYMAGWDRAAFDRFGARWPEPGFRRAMRRLTVAWGCWFAVQAIGRAVAAELLDVATFLAVWPFISNVGTLAMIVWSVNGSQGAPDTLGSAGGLAWDPVEHGARLGAAARAALDRAGEEARRHRHGYIGTEHLLIALADDPGPAGQLLRAVSATRETTRATLEAVVGLGNTSPRQEIELAPRMRSVLRRAFDAHRADGAAEIGTEHLLLGLLDEPDSQALNLLGYMGVDLAGLRGRLVHHKEPPPSLTLA